MKRSPAILFFTLCLLLCTFYWAKSWIFPKHIYAQQDTGETYTGSFYISAYIDIDSAYNTYGTGIIQEQEDTEIDALGLDEYISQDASYIAEGSESSPYSEELEFSLSTDGPVTPGHDYEMESDGYACYSDGDDNNECDDLEYIASAYASVSVPYPPPKIQSLSPYAVQEGDQGTLSITGSNLVQGSNDHLVVNFQNATSMPPFTATGTPSPTAASYSYDFTNYSPGTYNLFVTNNEGSSEPIPFTVAPLEQTYFSPTDPCAVSSSNNPQLGYTAIVAAGPQGSSGSLTVSFSAAAFSSVSATVTVGPGSTPGSIAASLAALISRNYYRSGLAAKAFGPYIIYSARTSLGSVSSQMSGSSFTTTNTSAAASAAEYACHNVPPPPPSAYSVAYSAYIPVDHVFGPDTCTPSGGTFPSQLIYNGNGFANSYKVTQALNINFASLQASGYFGNTGLTTNYGALSPRNGSTLSASDNDATYYDQRTNTGTADCYLRNAVGKADPSAWTYSANVTSSTASISMQGNSQNPLSYKFGAISWTITTHLNVAANTGYVEYDHTCYPAHQVRVANTQIYSYPKATDTTFNNSLFYIGSCLTGAKAHIHGTSSPVNIR